jgi:hypothetical protein
MNFLSVITPTILSKVFPTDSFELNLKKSKKLENLSTSRVCKF